MMTGLSRMPRIIREVLDHDQYYEEPNSTLKISGEVGHYAQ